MGNDSFGKLQTVISREAARPLLGGSEVPLYYENMACMIDILIS